MDTSQKVVEAIASKGSDFFNWIKSGVKKYYVPEHGEIKSKLSQMALDNKLITKTPFKSLNDKINKHVSITDPSAIPELNRNEMLDNELKEIVEKSNNPNARQEVFDIMGKMTPDNFEQEIGSVKKVLGESITDDEINMFTDLVDEYFDLAGTAFKGERHATVDGIAKYINAPLAYFKVDDPKIRNVRIGTAIGLPVGLAIGGRLLSGGSLTRDKYGQADIAGIPFI